MTSTFTYVDTRWGDTYQVTHLSGVFLSARRFVDGHYTQQLVYDVLVDLPQPAQNDIEQRLEELKS
jgi:hypothetical protein